jgi:hypothetical protein
MSILIDLVYQEDLAQLNMIILEGEDCFDGDEFSEMLEADMKAAVIEKRTEIWPSLCMDQLTRSMSNYIVGR